MTALLELVNVSKSFGDFQVLTDVDLAIEAGTVTCIVGPSGSGKSTMLRTINMLEPINAGAIFIDGQMIGQAVRGTHRVPVSTSVARKQRLNFGMVFQNFNLFPNYTVLDNITLAPISVKRLRKPDAVSIAEDMLEKVGLADKKDSYPNELSGGQQQRVAIARALAMQPRLLLFDEPTSALDPELVGEVLAVMQDLAAKGSTMLIVTHELQFAENVADEIVMMDAGRIIERGSPSELLHNPRTERAQRFFASIRRH